MNIDEASKMAQDALTTIVNGELSNSNAKNTINALGKVLALEVSKINYQKHIGVVEKIPFFEGEKE